MKTCLAGMPIYTLDSVAKMPIPTSICWIIKDYAIHIHGYNI